MKKVLYCFPHGLGDAIMATPALRSLKKQDPDLYIGLATMKRKDRDFKGLLSNLPFIDEIIPCLSDPWNDFTNYPDGLQGVLKEAQAVAKERGFDKTILIPTKRYGDGLELHKIFRIAYETSAIFNYIEDLQTELAITEDAEKRVEEFVKNYPRPFLVLHAKSGNPPKDLSSEEAENLIEKYKDHTVFEFGRVSTKRSILIKENDMEFTKALVKTADNVLAIDSVIMHIAGVFKRPLEAVFITTPIIQAIPLTYDCSVTIVDKVREQADNLINYKKQLSELFPKQSTAS